MGETSPWLKCILITLSIILFLFSLLMVTLFVLSWSSYKSHFQHQDEEMANQTITSDKPMVEDMVEIEQQMTIALIIFTSLLIISTILFLAVYLENLCLLYVSLTVSIIGFFILLIVMGIDLVLGETQFEI